MHRLSSMHTHTLAVIVVHRPSSMHAHPCGHCCAQAQQHARTPSMHAHPCGHCCAQAKQLSALPEGHELDEVPDNSLYCDKLQVGCEWG